MNESMNTLNFHSGLEEENRRLVSPWKTKNVFEIINYVDYFYKVKHENENENRMKVRAL